jgi:hypothetical protein
VVVIVVVTGMLLGALFAAGALVEAARSVHTLGRNTAQIFTHPNGPSESVAKAFYANGSNKSSFQDPFDLVDGFNLPICASGQLRLLPDLLWLALVVQVEIHHGSINGLRLAIVDPATFTAYCPSAT